MNRRDLICSVSELMAKDLELLKKKNMDYSPGEDALTNFRDFGAPGVITRIGDKYHRAKTWAQRGNLAVADEKIEDTMTDICVYGYITRVILRHCENMPKEAYNYEEISHGRPERE